MTPSRFAEIIWAMTDGPWRIDSDGQIVHMPGIVTLRNLAADLVELYALAKHAANYDSIFNEVLARIDAYQENQR